MKQNINKKYSLILIIFLALVTIGLTYSFFANQGNVLFNNDVNVTSNTTDLLTFQIDNDIDFEVSQSDFVSGGNNKSGYTNARAILIPNNKTGNATMNYYMYLNIEDNPIDYSSTNTNELPELMLQVFDANNELVTLDYLDEMVTVKGVTGYDITGYEGLIPLLDNQEIVASNNAQTTQEWKVVVTFINLDINQNDNTGKELVAEVIMQKDPYTPGGNLAGNLAVVIDDEIKLDNSLMKEYRGEGYYHDENDKDTEHPFFTKPIYYFGTDNDSEANLIKEKWNVVFGGFCWQVFRTTENGGVKLIYNGEPTIETNLENGKLVYNCSSSRSNHMAFSSKTTLDGLSESTAYYYGTSYEYDEENNYYKLAGSITNKTWNELNAGDLQGLYTCKSTNQNANCETIYLILSYNNATTANVLPMNSSTTTFVDYASDDIDFGNKLDSLSSVGYMYNEEYGTGSISLTGSADNLIRSTSITGNHLFSDNYSVNGSTYTLSNPSTANTIKSGSHSDNYIDLLGMFTCLSTSNSCTTIYQIIKVDNNTIYYISATSGDEIPIRTKYNITTSYTNISVLKKAIAGTVVKINTAYGSIDSFKLNGTTINGDTFTMPSSDVTISDIAFSSTINDLETLQNNTNYKLLANLHFFGNTYINTGIIPTNHTTEIKFNFESYDTEALFGTEQGFGYYSFISFNNKYDIGFNGTEQYLGTWTTGEHTLIFNGTDNLVKVDDDILSTNVAISSTSNLLLGKRGSAANLTGKIYYAKITDKSTNTLVRDFVPVVRISDYMVGLYDKVNDTFYSTYSAIPQQVVSLTGYFTVSSTVTKSGNNYVLTNPQYINWNDDYSDYIGYYICSDNVSTTCSENNLRYIYNTTSTSYSYYPIFIYSNKYTYDNGTYTLDMSDSNAINIPGQVNNYDLIGKAHYTCFNTSGVCTTINYVYKVDSNVAYYLPLTNGKYFSTDESNTSVFKNNNNVLYTMLYSDNVNSKSSPIKIVLDGWYAANLINYTQYIDSEEIYCNDRRTGNNYGSWNNNTNNITTDFNFINKTSNGNINCRVKNDAFSATETTLGNGDLTYPIGLISVPESNLMNYVAKLSNKVTYSGIYDIPSYYDYWLMSPSYFSNRENHGSVNGSNWSNPRTVQNGAYGDWIWATYNYNHLRPVIALKSTALDFSSGDGSPYNPYLISLGNNIILNDINYWTTKTKAVSGETIAIYHNKYVVGSFKLNGTNIIGNTFVMPNDDVTITDIKVYKIKNNSNNNNIILPNSAIPGNTVNINLRSNQGYAIVSFKLNGTTINGNTFTMPSNDITITDVVVSDVLTALRNNPNYQVLDYLTFDGNQYIDTGLAPTNHTTEIKFDFETYATEALLGTNQGYGYYSFISFNNKYDIGYSGSEQYLGTWTTGDHILIFNGDNNLVKVDDIVLSTGTNLSSTYNLWIGKRGSSSNLSGKVYYVKITNKTTNELERWLVPVLSKINGVIGMYDVINDRFYANNGTGFFSKVDNQVTNSVANSLAESFNNNIHFTKKEYLKFNTDQYINVNIIPVNHFSEIKADFGETGFKSLLGTLDNQNYYHFTLFSNSYYYGGNGSSDLYGGTYSNGIHTIQLNGDNNDVVVDNITIGSGINLYGKTVLFIGKRGGTANFDGKVYYFKLIDKSTDKVVRYLIPCARNSDSVVGMYDVVNDIFYTNQGSGTFTVPS